MDTIRRRARSRRKTSRGVWAEAALRTKSICGRPRTGSWATSFRTCSCSPWARRSRRRCYSKRLRSSLPSRRELGSRGRRRLRRGSWHGDRWGRGGSHDLLGRRDRTAVRLADDLAADDRPLVDEEPATFVDHIALDHAINFQVAAGRLRCFGHEAMEECLASSLREEIPGHHSGHVAYAVVPHEQVAANESSHRRGSRTDHHDGTLEPFVEDASAEDAYHVSVSRCLTRGRISRFRRAQACDPSHRSASRAAIEPKPAAVTACRYRKSWTSPAAKTPPPTTTTSRLLKKNPSHVAQALTPRPFRRSSFGRPRYLALAPVAMMTDRASWAPSEVHTMRGRFVKSTFDTLSSTKSALNRSACLRQSSMSSGPWTPLGNPG